MELNSYAELEMMGFFAFVAWLFYYQITSSRRAAREAEARQERAKED